MIGDEDLRESYARAVRARGTPAPGSCVAPEALLAVARGEGREAERLRTLDHAMACHACRSELELLRAIERAGGARTSVAIAGNRWRRPVSIALAASVLLALALGQWRGMLGTGGAPDAMRGAGPDVVAVAPAEDAVISRDAELAFVWRPLPGARGYTLELLSPEDAVMLARQTQDTTVVLRLARPLATGAYRWWVRAQDRDGVERQSGLRRVHVE